MHSKGLVHTREHFASPKRKHHKDFFCSHLMCKRYRFPGSGVRNDPHHLFCYPCCLGQTSRFFQGHSSFLWGFVGLCRAKFLSRILIIFISTSQQFIICLQRHSKTRRTKGLPFLSICSWKSRGLPHTLQAPVSWSNSCLAQKRQFAVDLDLRNMLQFSSSNTKKEKEKRK